MPIHPKKDQPSKKGSKKPDDLTAIKGIGDSLKQWLRESFKVHTFAEIAALSAHEVGARAKQDGRFLPLSKIEQILAQAREHTYISLLPASESRRRPNSKKESDWKEFASFVVNFERKVVRGKEKKRTKVERRTAIHHMETGEQESWSGVDAEQAGRWMLHRLSENGEIERSAKRKAKTKSHIVIQPADSNWQSSLPTAPATTTQTSVDILRSSEPDDKAPKVEIATAQPATQPALIQTAEIQSFQPLSPDQLQEMLTQYSAISVAEEVSKPTILPVAVPSSADIAVAQDVALEVTEIQVVQPSSTEQPQELFAQNRAFNGYIKGKEPLSFAVKFRLTGNGAAAVTKRNSPFSVVFNAENLLTSNVTRMGVSKPDFLKDGQLNYTALLAPLIVAPGVYHLSIVTTVRDPQPLWATIEVPVLQVVP